ncbi:hypothetical protein CC80DRAFT_431216 [Byssothecium circinans]|uniref:Histone deacetylase complex subunit SAP30 Sin3 binding domain-containing protein n=1 Tax=Byssothecium circinans TaxID=147558 RepID=A0A6A5THS5_9PLEO|nr:hypothetical protein CC80DRAFT_431459 [Byssothecium circinans]KAF1948607.1 hypothetical protein CC80DRAFT_431216 [Byssothecium circinans]
MPPAASKRAAEDTQSLKEKLHNLPNTSTSTARGGRRNGANNAINGSHLKDVMSSNGDNANEPEYPTNWETQPSSVLHAYRRAYRMDTATAYKNPLSHVVLNQGIGKMSPTSARPRGKRRVEKRDLATEVRKHFNAQAVSETNCIIELIYKTKHQDSEFRVRFAPQRR